MNDDNFLKTLAANLNQNASVKNVFGEPVRAGDKVIIPVAQLMLGIGGGYGHSSEQNKQLLLTDPSRTASPDKPQTPAEGAGGGGGMRVVAKGVYEITPNRIRFIPARDVRQGLLVLAAGFLMGSLAASRLAGKTTIMAVGKRFLVFLTLAFGWSWGCWLLSPIAREQSALAASALMFLGGFGPSLAAVALVWHEGGLAALRTWLSRCLRWRVGWVWVAVAILLPLAVMALAAAIHLALGGTIPPSPIYGHALLAAVNFVLILLLGGPLGEEFGWRGYALPILQKRYDWRRASLVLGIVWGGWHFPLFYIANTSQQYIPVGLFMVSTVAMSVLFAWLANRTAGSLVPAILFHTAINYWSWVVPVIPDGGSLRPYELATGLMVVVAGVLLYRSKPHPSTIVESILPA